MKSVTRKKDNKSRLQEAILGESSARRELLLRRRGGRVAPKALFCLQTVTFQTMDFFSEKAATLGHTGAKDGLRWRKDQTEWKQVKHERMKQNLEDSSLGRNFSAGNCNVFQRTSYAQPPCRYLVRFSAKVQLVSAASVQLLFHW